MRGYVYCGHNDINATQTSRTFSAATDGNDDRFASAIFLPRDAGMLARYMLRPCVCHKSVF